MDHIWHATSALGLGKHEYFEKLMQCPQKMQSTSMTNNSISNVITKNVPIMLPSLLQVGHAYMLNHTECLLCIYYACINPWSYTYVLLRMLWYWCWSIKGVSTVADRDVVLFSQEPGKRWLLTHRKTPEGWLFQYPSTKGSSQISDVTTPELQFTQARGISTVTQDLGNLQGWRFTVRVTTQFPLLYSGMQHADSIRKHDLLVPVSWLMAHPQVLSPSLVPCNINQHHHHLTSTSIQSCFRSM